VQTLVKANGKNNSSTFFPVKSESEINFFSLSYKLKAGAF
jgi:hypothetical protein